jgi:Domain of unknown function (DUF5615)
VTATRLLLDEMLSGEIARQLRDGGHDVRAVVEDRALIGVADEDLRAQATVEGRCVVTANVRDFAALHAAWASAGRSHAGILYVVTRVFPQDRSFLGALVNALEFAVIHGQIPASGQESYLSRQQR